jgi:hypothetical protein
MTMLLLARIVVAGVPFRLWRDRLGAADAGDQSAGSRTAHQLAADVEWAASRLPLGTKCLPRAMALSWMLRRNRIAHGFVFAVRPESSRLDEDRLHAWVEVGGGRLIGDLPGPWIETLRLGDKPHPP